jgi:tetratricopeptide (TPR) repeat protein
LDVAAISSQCRNTIEPIHVPATRAPRFSSNACSQLQLPIEVSMRAFAPWVILCPLLAAAPVGAAPDAATRSLIDAGHWKQARAILEPRVKANPSDAEAAALLSQVRAQFGDLDGALALAEAAVTLEPKVADYHYRLAEIVGSLAQRASVFKQFGLARRFRQEAEAAIALDATHIEARVDMLEYYIQAPGIVGGDRKKADAMAEEIARIDPASGYLAKARILIETKTAGDLEGLFRQAAAVAKSAGVKWEATSRLMNLYLAPKTSRPDAAEQQARMLLTIDPHRTGGYAGLAIVYATAGRLDDLDAVLADAEKAVPDSFRPFFLAGQVLVTQGKELPRAERYLRRYLTLEPEPGGPGLAHAHWRVGQALEKEGKRGDAIAELEQATKLKPDLEDAKKDLKRLRAGS